MRTKHLQHRITNAETGAKKPQQLPKRVLPWCYCNSDDSWFIDLKYGNRRLNIADGKSTIEVGKQDQLLKTFDILVEAANAGELDEQLVTFKKKVAKA